MKIRNGFVSNSSSSSYIIAINGLNITGFTHYLMTEYAYDFNIDSIKKEIQESIDQCNKSLKENESLSFGIKNFLNEVMNERMTFLEELKKTIEEKQDDNTLVETRLKLHGINLKELGYGIELDSFTSMHNSFNEGMPELLKEIVLFFVFDHKMQVICKRESDNF